MEIHVLSREMAIKYVPDRPELLIGILDSKHPFNIPVVPKPNKLRLDYLTYTFDDIDEKFEDYVLINEDVAARILDDFSRYKESIESLAIHCRAGVSRSPAVAAALNECFSLGHNPGEFFGEQYRLNYTVYMVICSAAKKLEIR